MRYTRTVLTTLLFFTSFLLTLSAHSSSSDGASAVQSNAAPTGLNVAAGSYVPGELIFSFNSPLTDSQKENFKDALGQRFQGTVVEWSPSQKYVRVDLPAFTTCEITELMGQGKPLIDIEGEGVEADFNYIASTHGGWVVNTSGCEIAPEGTVVESKTGSTQDYTPLDNCQGPNSILPPTGNSSVRVAIIDSGVRGGLSSGTIDNVAHEQTIVPRDCRNEADCIPIRPQSSLLTRSAHPHGFYIFKIIANWFRNEGLENQLRVHSYQVLDGSLTCTQFQVIKAIELASSEFRANLINLSITFKKASCGRKTAQNSTAIRRVIKDVQARGVIVLAAAGNSYNDLSNNPEYPAAEEGLNNLVVVGATSCNSTSRIKWSNYSAQHVDLLTLGERIKVKTGTCEHSLKGTSYATPIVTAKAAFHITQQSRYNYQDVLCKLRSQAKPHPDAIYGTVDKYKNGSCKSKAMISDQEFKVPAENATWIDAALLVKPNPFGDEFTFEIEGDLADSKGQVKLLDFNGRLLFEQAYVGGRQTLMVAGLTPGLYLLRIVTDRGELVKRIVKR